MWLPSISMMVKLNQLKCLIYFILLVLLAITCRISYPSSFQDRKVEMAQPWRIEMKKTEEYQDLASMLKSAAMDDNTVIITTLNEAWAAPNSMFDTFLESFHVGEQTEQFLRHMVVVAMDPKAFDRCKAVHPHCYFLITEGVGSAVENLYRTQGFLNLVWRRKEFMKNVLELGYNFLFTDADIIWLRNPFPYFPRNAHLVTASDEFNGNHSDINNQPNNGFIYVKSCHQTIEFYRHWHLARSLHPNATEQDVFNKIKFDEIAQLSIRIWFLDNDIFCGFCKPPKDFNKFCTLHANCCIGLEGKIHDLRIALEDWKNYTARTAEEKKLRGFSWRIPDKCRLMINL